MILVFVMNKGLCRAAEVFVRVLGGGHISEFVVTSEGQSYI